MMYLPFASSRRTVLAMICFVVLIDTSAWTQQNLLTNPGFETGGFTGWTVTPDPVAYGVNTAGFIIPGTYPEFGPMPVIVHSGTYASYAAVCSACYPPPNGIYLGLSQTLTLTPGDIYTVSFWIGNGSSLNFGGYEQVLVNGQLAFWRNPTIFPGYQMISGTFTALQATNTITFILSGSGTGAAGLAFDDLSVVDTGSAPGHGDFAFLVNQSQNQVSSYGVNPYTGDFVPGSGSPFGTGTAPVAVAGMGPSVYVADQGSSQISVYTMNIQSGRMLQIPSSPYSAGIAPGAIAIHRSLHLLYASGIDSNGNGAIAAWKFLPGIGTLTPVAGSPFPAGVNPGTIAFDHTGRYAYVVDKASNQLLAYGVDPGSGALTPLSGSPYATGASPSAVAVDTAFNYVYITNSGGQSITGYKIAGDGSLTSVPGSPFPTGTTPVSLTFDRLQRYLYVANSGSSNIWAYQIAAGTGSLSTISGSPYNSSPQPQTIVTSESWVYTNTTAGISAYQINSGTGALTEIPGSPLPYFGTALGTNGVLAAGTH
jgi:6-phosphogluconolactonase (cycloisomerase 2 family)